MLKLCLSIACGMLVAMPQADARRAEKLPNPPAPGTIDHFFIPELVVDGLPLFRQGYRIWTGWQWIPMLDTHQGERPIPRQRRLE